MESEPSKKEPERPEAHPGSGDEADAREPHGDLLRAQSDLPAEGKTQGMKKGTSPKMIAETRKNAC
jgi:hypothetical protein